MPAERPEPAEPTDISRPSWALIARRTGRGFVRHQLRDSAAGLTFYGLLGVAPATLAVMSLLGLVGGAKATADAVVNAASAILPGSAPPALRALLERVTQSPTTGVAFALGLIGALWTTSAYVGAFGRAMNRIYGAVEGRPFWRFRPVMMLVTLVVLVAVAGSMGLLLLGETAQGTLGAIIDIGRWPLMCCSPSC